MCDQCDYVPSRNWLLKVHKKAKHDKERDQRDNAKVLKNDTYVKLEVEKEEGHAELPLFQRQTSTENHIILDKNEDTELLNCSECEYETKILLCNVPII